VTRVGPLAAPDFRRFFFARAISFLGDNFTIVALAFAVLDLTGSTRDLGWVLTAYWLPFALLALAGGVWADRLPRHLVMVGTNSFSAAVQAATAALLLSGSARLWLLVVLQALAGTARAFFSPAARGLLQQTVEVESLQKANALVRVALRLAQIGGAAIGGLVVGAFGPGWGLAVDASTFAAAAVALVGMRVPRVEQPRGRGFGFDLAEGWREFRAREWLWVVVAAFTFINFAAGAWTVLGPPTAKAQYGGASAWGAILAANGAGLLLGGALALRLPLPRRPLLSGQIACVVFALPLALLGPPLRAIAVGAGAFAAGVAIELFEVWWETTMQRRVPPAIFGRLAAWDTVGSFAAQPLGIAIAAPVAAAIGRGETLYGAAAVMVVASLAALLSRDVRTLAAA
jgi:MFS family permease